MICFCIVYNLKTPDWPAVDGATPDGGIGVIEKGQPEWRLAGSSRQAETHWSVLGKPSQLRAPPRQTQPGGRAGWSADGGIQAEPELSSLPGFANWLQPVEPSYQLPSTAAIHAGQLAREHQDSLGRCSASSPLSFHLLPTAVLTPPPKMALTRINLAPTARTLASGVPAARVALNLPPQPHHGHGAGPRADQPAKFAGAYGSTVVSRVNGALRRRREQSEETSKLGEIGIGKPDGAARSVSLSLSLANLVAPHCRGEWNDPTVVEETTAGSSGAHNVSTTARRRTEYRCLGWPGLVVRCARYICSPRPPDPIPER